MTFQPKIYDFQMAASTILYLLNKNTKKTWPNLACSSCPWTDLQVPLLFQEESKFSGESRGIFVVWIKLVWEEINSCSKWLPNKRHSKRDAEKGSLIVNFRPSPQMNFLWDQRYIVKPINMSRYNFSCTNLIEIEN